MEQLTKLVTKSGNGAIVYVPSKWLYKKVTLSLIDVDFTEELFYLVKPYLKHIMGVYLYGSYTRNEQLENSDIDILMIVDKKFNLKQNRFDIHLVEINAFKNGLKKNPILFYSIIKEAKPIFNQYLLEELKKIKIKDFSWFIDTTKSALKVSKTLLKLDEKYANHASIYSIILRSRGLYLMTCIKKNKPYTNKDFLNYLTSLGFEKNFVNGIYEVYRAEKNDRKISSKIEVNKVYDLCLKIEKELKKHEKKKEG